MESSARSLMSDRMDGIPKPPPFPFKIDDGTASTLMAAAAAADGGKSPLAFSLDVTNSFKSPFPHASDSSKSFLMQGLEGTMALLAARSGVDGAKGMYPLSLDGFRNFLPYGSNDAVKSYLQDRLDTKPHKSSRDRKDSKSNNSISGDRSSNSSSVVGSSGDSQSHHHHHHRHHGDRSSREHKLNNSSKKQSSSSLLKSQLSNPRHDANLTHAIRELHDEEFALDAVLLAEGGHVGAHCAVLAAASPFLKTILLNANDHPAIITVTGTSLATLQTLVECLYTGNIPSGATLSHLIDAAKLLKMEALALVLQKTYFAQGGSLDQLVKSQQSMAPSQQQRSMATSTTTSAFTQSGLLSPQDIQLEKFGKKFRGSRLDQILYQKLNMNHLVPSDMPEPPPLVPPMSQENSSRVPPTLLDVNCTIPSSVSSCVPPLIDASHVPHPPSTADLLHGGILGELLTKADPLRTMFSNPSIYSIPDMTFDPTRATSAKPLNLSKTSKSEPSSSTTTSGVTSSISTVSSITSTTATSSSPSSNIPSNLPSQTDINLAGLSSLAPSLPVSMPGLFTLSPSISSMISPSALASLTTSPALASLGSQHSTIPTSKSKSSSSSGSSRSRSTTKTSSSTSNSRSGSSNRSGDNSGKSSHNLPLLYTLKGGMMTPEMAREVYEQLRVNPQLASLAGFNSVPNLSNLSSSASLQNLANLHNLTNLQFPPSLFPFLASAAENPQIVNVDGTPNDKVLQPSAVESQSTGISTSTLNISTSSNTGNSDDGVLNLSSNAQAVSTESSSTTTSSGTSAAKDVSEESKITPTIDAEQPSNSNTTGIVEIKDEKDINIKPVTSLANISTGCQTASAIADSSENVDPVATNNNEMKCKIPNGCTTSEDIKPHLLPSQLDPASIPLLLMQTGGNLGALTHNSAALTALSQVPGGLAKLSQTGANLGPLTQIGSHLGSVSQPGGNFGTLSQAGASLNTLAQAGGSLASLAQSGGSLSTLTQSGCNLGTLTYTGGSYGTLQQPGGLGVLSQPPPGITANENIDPQTGLPKETDGTDTGDDNSSIEVVDEIPGVSQLQNQKALFHAGQMLTQMGRKRKGCGDCEGCQVVDDCGQCRFCRDKAKFGGPNRLKQVCVYKRCVHTEMEPDDSKKRRKNSSKKGKAKCGGCDGCQRTVDCNECYACLHNAAATAISRRKICEMRVCEQQQMEEVRAALSVAGEPSPYSTDSLMAEGINAGSGTNSPTPDGHPSTHNDKMKLMRKMLKKKFAQPYSRVSPSKVRTKYYCGECPGCQTTTPCGNCLYCEDMPKFGGPGRYRQKCVKQLCVYHPRLQALKLSNRSKMTYDEQHIAPETLNRLSSGVTGAPVPAEEPVVLGCEISPERKLMEGIHPSECTDADGTEGEDSNATINVDTNSDDPNAENSELIKEKEKPMFVSLPNSNSSTLTPPTNITTSSYPLHHPLPYGMLPVCSAPITGCEVPILPVTVTPPLPHSASHPFQTEHMPLQVSCAAEIQFNPEITPTPEVNGSPTPTHVPSPTQGSSVSYTPEPPYASMPSHVIPETTSMVNSPELCDPSHTVENPSNSKSIYEHVSSPVVPVVPAVDNTQNSPSSSPVSSSFVVTSSIPSSPGVRTSSPVEVQEEDDIEIEGTVVSTTIPVSSNTTDDPVIVENAENGNGPGEDAEMSDTSAPSPPSSPSPPPRARGRGRQRARGRVQAKSTRQAAAVVTKRNITRRGRRLRTTRFSLDPDDTSDFDETIGNQDENSIDESVTSDKLTENEHTDVTGNDESERSTENQSVLEQPKSIDRDVFEFHDSQDNVINVNETTYSLKHNNNPYAFHEEESSNQGSRDVNENLGSVSEAASA